MAPCGARVARSTHRATLQPRLAGKGLRRSFGIKAETARLSLPTIAVVLGHADIAMTEIYATGVGIEARGFPQRMRDASR